MLRPASISIAKQTTSSTTQHETMRSEHEHVLHTASRNLLKFILNPYRPSPARRTILHFG